MKAATKPTIAETGRWRELGLQISRDYMEWMLTDSSGSRLVDTCCEVREFLQSLGIDPDKHDQCSHQPEPVGRVCLLCGEELEE